MSFNDRPLRATTSFDRLLNRTSGVVKGILVGLFTSLAIACQTSTAPISQSSTTSSPSIATTPAASENSAPAEAAQSEQRRYINDEIGFSFAYPHDLVLDSQPDQSTPAEDSLEVTLDLWQQEQYQAIQAGEYEGGTEFPPNVQVAVYRHDSSPSHRTDLEAWVKANNRFMLRGEFQTQAIAGQEALVFSSDGLYGYQNVVLPSLSGNEMIVISLAQIEVSELDEPNQRAFEQVISTFQWID